MELGHFLSQQLQQLFIHSLLQDTRDCIVVNTQVKDFVSFFGIIGQTTALDGFKPDHGSCSLGSAKPLHPPSGPAFLAFVGMKQ